MAGNSPFDYLNKRTSGDTTEVSDRLGAIEEKLGIAPVTALGSFFGGGQPKPTGKKDRTGYKAAIKDIKKIPDCSVKQAYRRLSSILKAFNEQQTKALIQYALLYPPRVRALVGAILEQIGSDHKGLAKLKDSLNPLSTFTLGLSEEELPIKSKWYIA